MPCASDDQGYELTVGYEAEHNPDGAMTGYDDYSQLYRTPTVAKIPLSICRANYQSMPSLVVPLVVTE